MADCRLLLQAFNKITPVRFYTAFESRRVQDYGRCRHKHCTLPFPAVEDKCTCSAHVASIDLWQSTLAEPLS